MLVPSERSTTGYRLYVFDTMHSQMHQHLKQLPWRDVPLTGRTRTTVHAATRCVASGSPPSRLPAQDALFDGVRRVPQPGRRPYRIFGRLGSRALGLAPASEMAD